MSDKPDEVEVVFRDHAWIIDAHFGDGHRVERHVCTLCGKTRRTEYRCPGRDA